MEGGSCCQRQRSVIANSSWREEAAVSARDQLLQTQVGGRKLLSAPEISYCKLKLEGGSCCQRQRSVIANSSWREEAAVSARDQLLQKLETLRNTHEGEQPRVVMATVVPGVVPGRWPGQGDGGRSSRRSAGRRGT